MTQKTLVLIKPDGVHRRMTGQVITAIETLGLEIQRLELKRLNVVEAEALYAEHKGKWHFKRNIKHILSGPCVAIKVSGKNALELCRTMVKSCRQANEDVIKLPANLIHASSNKDNVLKELMSLKFDSPPRDLRFTEEKICLNA